jgi:hypothetical protein
MLIAMTTVYAKMKIVYAKQAMKEMVDLIVQVCLPSNCLFLFQLNLDTDKNKLILIKK